MELIGTKEERNAPVAAAIGEESFDDKPLYMNTMKINEMRMKTKGYQSACMCNLSIYQPTFIHSSTIYLFNPTKKTEPEENRIKYEMVLK